LLVHLTACAASAGKTRSRLFELLSAKPLVTVGHFSYSLYLTHLPVMALCYFALLPLHLAPGPFALTLLGVSGAASLAIAYAFHLAFERPFMQTR
jgi:peptidoglycan/LPS O-acetylase OafA/YrhL